MTSQSATFQPFPTAIGARILIMPNTRKISIAFSLMSKVNILDGRSTIKAMKIINNPPTCDKIKPVCNGSISLPIRNLKNIDASPVKG
jgi:hypothetical protein